MPQPPSSLRLASALLLLGLCACDAPARQPASPAQRAGATTARTGEPTHPPGEATGATTGAVAHAAKAPAPPKAPEVKPAAVLDLVALQKAGAFASFKVVDADVPHDPAYEKQPMKYRGYRLADVLALLPKGLDWSAHEVRLSALDGYTVTVPMAQLRGDQGVLAIADREAGDARWKTFRQGKREVIPAPFYLVWHNTKYGPDRPWPYQLARISVVSIKAAYGDAYPEHDAQALAGFRVFKARCMACHSVNLSGGTLGPELNVPRNITEYWREEHLRGLIRNARDYRARSIMPAFKDLKAEDLDHLLAYLRAMKAAKVCADEASCAKRSAP